METDITFDLTDPIAAVAAWALTQLAGRYMPADSKWRAALPAVAILTAIAARAIADVALGHPLTVELLLRSFAAGAVAVFGHSQFREFMKVAIVEPKPPKPKTRPKV